MMQRPVLLMFSSQPRYYILPSILLGLGVGYVLAQPQVPKQRLRERLKHLASKGIPLWLVLATISPQAYVPFVVLGWFLNQVALLEEDDDDDDENDDDTRNDDKLKRQKAQPLTPRHDRTTPTVANVATTTAVTTTTSTTPILHHEVSISLDKSIAAPQRHLELLVHNVAHTDLVLSLNAPAVDNVTDETEPSSPYCLCRPRFSAFDLYTRRILSSLVDSPEVVSFPRYERSDDNLSTIVTPRPSRQKQIPTGFALTPHHANLQIPNHELPNLRARGKDAPRIEPYLQSGDDEAPPLYLNFAFFPLLAGLMPRWKSEVVQKYNPQASVKQVILLVSGVGTPRNWTHSMSGNSTQICAQLMQVFLNKTYPDVTVVLVHSETNLFRYGENIEFAKHELRPVLDAYRDAHARGLAYPDEGVVLRSGFHDAPFSPDWKRSFHVTISYADGSPARTHAIQAALRPYRPHYLHHWQLKSFWHDAKIVDDDIESHDFEEMETVPAMEASRIIDNEVKLVIAEMQAFRLEFLHIMLEGRSDIRDFWLRKTRKPVLAVLLVQSAGSSKPILYRGTNMEVSMPTGSLCAERNVIGTALASDPGLKRQDLKMVAVLAVPLPPDKDAQVPMSRNWSFASYSSLVQAADSDTEQQTDDWVLPGREVEQRLDQAVERRPRSESLAEDPPGTPMRRIRLYNNAAADNKARRARRSVLVHCSDQDLNPLRPCGACNEWLKKISESNPYFSVVTFTDAECKGVYVTPCQE